MVPIARTSDPRELERWSFALEAMQIPFEVVPGDDESTEAVVWVRREHAAQAHRAVVELDIEDSRVTPPPPEVAAVSHPHATLWALAITWLLATVSLILSEAPSWVERGALSGDAFARGQWYRSVTAITLHSGLAHLLANCAFLALLAWATIARVGPGIALASAVACGTLANVVSALVHPLEFSAIGASGAVFALLGLAAALTVRASRAGGARRWLPGVGAALALFAWTGIAPRSDVVAHFAGAVLGFLAGFAVPVAGSRPPRIWRNLQWLSGAAAALGLVAAWMLALEGS